MIKQLKKVGNSNAIFLDKAILELAGLREGGEVQITVDGGSIVLTPTRPKRVTREQLDEALDQIVKERREVLERLAK